MIDLTSDEAKYMEVLGWGRVFQDCWYHFHAKLSTDTPEGMERWNNDLSEVRLHISKKEPV